MQRFSYKSNQRNCLNHVTADLSTEIMLLLFATFHYHHVTAASWVRAGLEHFVTFCLSSLRAVSICFQRLSAEAQKMPVA